MIRPTASGRHTAPCSHDAVTFDTTDAIPLDTLVRPYMVT